MRVGGVHASSLIAWWQFFHICLKGCLVLQMLTTFGHSGAMGCLNCPAWMNSFGCGEMWLDILYGHVQDSGAVAYCCTSSSSMLVGPSAPVLHLFGGTDH